MTTSLSYDYNKNRNQIITRSLRIVGAIGQGETPNATAITEVAEVLNDLVKEWEADGMQLWCIKTYTLPIVAGTASYTVGLGSNLNEVAPTKLLQAWSRTTTNLDTPILLITRHEYNMLGSKTTQGSPSQLWYNPPGEISITETEGTITLYVTPSSNYSANSSVMFTGVRPIQDFDSATDTMDFPQYWANAIVWGLADQLSYEYGVGLSERAMISKKAELHKEKALSYGTEEGHLLIQPAPHWQTENW